MHPSYKIEGKELTRPRTLTRGARYVLLKSNDSKPSLQTVHFISYAPCSAVVKIRAESGQIQRCLRDQLFTPVAPGVDQDQG